LWLGLVVILCGGLALTAKPDLLIAFFTHTQARGLFTILTKQKNVRSMQGSNHGYGLPFLPLLLGTHPFFVGVNTFYRNPVVFGQNLKHGPGLTPVLARNYLNLVSLFNPHISLFVEFAIRFLPPWSSVFHNLWP